MAEALPPIDSSLVPASVRAGGAGATKLYETALSFESMLTEQLAQALTSSLDDSSSEDGGGGDATTSMYAQLLPAALARGVTASGGLGLAPELYQALGGTTKASGS